jgi:flagellar capping protein FliD
VKQFVTEYNNLIDTVGKYTTYDSNTRRRPGCCLAILW